MAQSLVNHCFIIMQSHLKKISHKIRSSFLPPHILIFSNVSMAQIQILAIKTKNSFHSRKVSYNNIPAAFLPVRILNCKNIDNEEN